MQAHHHGLSGPRLTPSPAVPLRPFGPFDPAPRRDSPLDTGRPAPWTSDTPPDPSEGDSRAPRTPRRRRRAARRRLDRRLRHGERRRLRHAAVGTEGTYSPFSYQGTDGQLTGYDIEVAQAVGAKLGKKVEFVQTPLDAIFAGLEAKRFDLIANQVTINDERKAKYDLSEPYTVSEGVIVTRADDTSITSLANLKGKTTAQSSTSNWAQVARDAGAKVEAVEGFVQAIQLLKDGRVDATVNDTLAVGEYQQTNNDAGIKIAGHHRRHQRAGVRRPQGQRADRGGQQGAGRAARRRHAEADLGEVLRLRRQRCGVRPELR